MYGVLICDDEKDIRNALRIYLNGEGYRIYEAENGKQALELLEKEDIQLVLMDIMMPMMDGVTATSMLRERYNLPVILLTAKSEDSDKILGLTVGADDYITKPFNPLEVIARVRVQLRRYATLGGMKAQAPKNITVGGVTLDDEGKTVTVDGAEVSLTPTEYDILKLLMSTPGKVYSSKEIYRIIWEEAPMGAENSVAVHIRHLREKLEFDPANPRYLKVVWGKGYKMEE